MSSEGNHNKSLGQSIEATEFQAPGKPSQPESTQVQSGLNRGLLVSRADAPWWHSQFNLMLCVFGLLGLATVLFVLVTPAPTVVTESTLISADGEASVGAPAAAPEQTEQAAPFSESQQEQARADSQDVLSELLDAKKVLEAKDVSNWGEQPFNAALGLAEQGDELYQRQEYAPAIEKYKQAVEALDAINDLVPAELARRVSAGMAAVEEGKSELAKEQFQGALQLDQNYIPALQGLERVKTLDQVLALAAAAMVDEQDFANSDQLSDIQQAKAKYEQAIALDSQAEMVKASLQNATELETDKHYRLAMTEGFNALFARRYSAARSNFNKALEYKPEDNTAKSALRQSLASDKRTSLASLLTGAKQFEKQEQWASALSNYQTVLQRDRNQVGARIGRIRAQARVDLDRSIKKVLSDPLELSKDTARQAAEAVLKDARAIGNKGSVLTRQITALESSLTQADNPVKVSFNSDSLTRVTLKKDGAKRIDLGKFDIKKLALKPGRYALTGTRLGFRDVRTEIELLPGTNDVQALTIACNELIADAG